MSPNPKPRGVVVLDEGDSPVPERHADGVVAEESIGFPSRVPDVKGSSRHAVQNHEVAVGPTASQGRDRWHGPRRVQRGPRRRVSQVHPGSYRTVAPNVLRRVTPRAASVLLDPARPAARAPASRLASPARRPNPQLQPPSGVHSRWRSRDREVAARGGATTSLGRARDRSRHALTGAASTPQERRVCARCR
jgi:hypothetical protein